jgi:uncharacterized protein (TIGR00369 family)
MTVPEGLREVNLTGAPYGAPWEDWVGWINDMPVSSKLGIRCTAVSEGKVTVVHAGGEWLNATGTAVHGGAIVAIADQCFGAVASTVLPEGVVPATATLTSDFLRPAFPPVTFESSVDRVGRTLVFVTVTARDRNGKVCNEVRGTMVVDGSSRMVADRRG